MNFIIKYLVIFIFCCSCMLFDKKDQDTVKEFEAEAFLRLYSAYNLTLYKKKYLNSGHIIDRPPLATVKLAKISLVGEEVCLLYKVPHLTDETTEYGELLFVESIDDCSVNLSSNNKRITNLKYIKNLKLYLKKQKLILKFKYKNEKYSISLDLSNIELGRYREIIGEVGRDVHRRYSSGIKDLASSNSYILGPDFDISSSYKLLGKIEDRYSKKTLIRCHDVKDNCKVNGAFTCSQCKFGWFNAIASECKTKYVKFCGPRRCGEKGEPACIRGNIYRRSKNLSLCFDGSPAGFCQKGLKTTCNDEKVLICR